MKMTKKAMLMLLTVCVMALCTVLCAANVSAANVVKSGECGDKMTWVLYDDGRLVIDGEGEMWSDFFRRLTHDDQIEVVNNINNGVSISHYQIVNSAENTLMEFALNEKGISQSELHKQTQKILKLTEENGKLKEQISQGEKFYNTMMQQAEEIGRLKERIAQLEREKGKDASGAPTSGVANAG